MNIESVREFIQLAKEEGVTELKYEEKDFKIHVNFNNTLAPTQIQPRPVAVTVEQPHSGSIREEQNVHVVTSPFVGTFYSQSSPGKPAFVKVGDRISKGQTLCILEAMKIMNEIESEVAGEVVEVCVENENLVEYGQPLFKVRV